MFFTACNTGERTVGPTRLVENVIRRVHEAMPMEQIGEDLRRNVSEAVAAAIERMDLVTREELDHHLEVLARAEARLEALERRVEAIEASPPPRQASDD